MKVLSLHSKVDEIRVLLNDLQSNFPYFPIKHQKLVSTALDNMAFQLKAGLNTDIGQQESQEILLPGLGRRERRSPPADNSESWLGLALKHSRSGAWMWDLSRDILRLSSELCELLDIDPAENTGDPQIFYSMLHPDDNEEKLGEIDEAVKRGGPFYLEFRVVNQDGKTIWLSSAGTVEHDSSGKPTRATGINQDITARKMMEQELRLSEERERAKALELKTLMDAVPAMIWISRDSECKEMVGNQYGYQFLQMWEGANISKTAPARVRTRQPYRNFKNGHEIPASELPMQMAAAKGIESSNYEFDLVFDHGATKNLLGNVLPILDQDGKPSGAIGAFVDITERKQMESELRRNEARLRMWKDHISFWNKATSSFFWLLGPDGSYQDPILTDPGISGKPLKQTQGWDWIKIVHPDDQDQTRMQWQHAIKQQRAFEIESRVWHDASRKYRWFSHRAVPVLENETLTGWIGASIDIHDRKEAEQALRESELRFRVALASAPLAVFTADRALRYTWFYSAQPDFSQDQLIGMRDDEILSPEDAAELIDIKQTVIETGQAVQQEIKIKVNGAWSYYIIAFDPIRNPEGQVSGLVGATLNITKQRQLESIQKENEIRIAMQQRLIETREDERIKIARDIHDGALQTLVGMTLNLQILKVNISDESLKAQLELIQSGIKNIVQELRDVIYDLRPPALVQGGLVMAIKEYIDGISRTLPGLHIIFDCKSQLDDLDKQSQLILYRICQEALHNVIRHARATKVDVRVGREKELLSLVVEDNGLGFIITNDITERVADKHYGLAGMKERAETIGGTLQVSSQPGAGTKIEVRIPYLWDERLPAFVP
jgi:PAS domain S-box-containing protein